MSTIKRKAEWIAPSFGDSPEEYFSIGKPVKRKDVEAIDLTVEDLEDLQENQPWIEKYKPSCENDLAVHKKKVQDVRHCLQGHIANEDSKNDAGILLLDGPAGSGKTAVIDVLAKELSCELKEWINPVGQDYLEKSSDWRNYLSRQESQSELFRDFLLRANRYAGLTLVGSESGNKSRKIIVIEDLPNFVLRDPKKLHVLLRQYRTFGRTPLVFIMSDTQSSDASVHSIFPKNIQAEFRINNISFNAIALTSLVKVMTKIVKEESKMENLVVPTKEIYEMLATSSNGDVRSCINSLQFYCTNTKCFTKRVTKCDDKVPQKKLKRKKTSKDKASASTEIPNICGRDASLFLFRALGKILYCKRTQKIDSFERQLPHHLKHFERDSLLVDPEDVFERTQITSDTFGLYLHQNYPQFYSSIDDLSSASRYVSDADIMNGVWANRHLMSDYCSSIAMRGIMFSNTTSPSSSGAVAGGWRPLHKPQWFESFKTKNSHHRTCKELFQDSRITSYDLYTDFFPYINKLNTNMKTFAHKQFAQEVGTFRMNKVNQRNYLQPLCDGVDEIQENMEADSDFTFASKHAKKDIDFDELSDELIEDFDDDWE